VRRRRGCVSDVGRLRTAKGRQPYVESGTTTIGHAASRTTRWPAASAREPPNGRVCLLGAGGSSWGVETPSQRVAGLRLTRADLLAIALGTLALIAGVVTLLIAPGFTAAVIGAFLIGVSAVAFVAFAFLLVGESEDRSYDRRTR
jgi:hypothetical protein